jgi:quercetin dioxygenase-like cupin family protein
MTERIDIELKPDERLGSDRLSTGRDQLIRVSDGVVYVALEDDDVVLTAGDSIVVRAHEPRRVWNAADVTARLVVADVARSRVPLAAAA